MDWFDYVSPDPFWRHLEPLLWGCLFVGIYLVAKYFNKDDE